MKSPTEIKSETLIDQDLYKTKEKTNATAQKDDQTVEINAVKYLLINFLVHLPCMYICTYFIVYFFPFLRLIGFDSLFGLTNTSILGIQDFWLFILLPIYLVFIYFLYIACHTLIAAGLVAYWNRISPPVQGLFQRRFGKGDVLDMRLKYYHYRGFIIKDPLWLASKSPFPWLMNWVLNIVGHNKIEQGAVYMDCFPCLEFCTLKKGAIINPGVLTSSHVVDSLYGNLTLKYVYIGENVVYYPHAVNAPDQELRANINIMPMTMCIKSFRPNNKDRFYGGAPAKPIDKIYSGVLSVIGNGAQELFESKGVLLNEDIEKLRVMNNT